MILEIGVGRSSHRFVENHYGKMLIVSHSDTIKLIVAHYLGQRLDEFQKLEIAPASFTIFKGDSKRISLITLNNSGNLREILA